MAVMRSVVSILGLAVTAALATSCIDDSEPSMARVLIRADPASPLELVVSRTFEVVASEDGDRSVPVLLTADTTALTGDFDESFDITETRRIYVRVLNDEEEPEIVRVRVYLDGDLFFDSTDQLADGRDVEYFYVSHSFR